MSFLVHRTTHVRNLVFACFPTVHIVGVDTTVKTDSMQTYIGYKLTMCMENASAYFNDVVDSEAFELSC